MIIIIIKIVNNVKKIKFYKTMLCSNSLSGKVHALYIGRNNYCKPRGMQCIINRVEYTTFKIDNLEY